MSNVGVKSDLDITCWVEGRISKSSTKHDNKTWYALWQEGINQASIYVTLAAKFKVKDDSDYKKTHKARELKKHIDHIRMYLCSSSQD